MSEYKYKSGEPATVGDRVSYKVPNGSVREGEVKALPGGEPFMYVMRDGAASTSKVRPGGATKIG